MRGNKDNRRTLYQPSTNIPCVLWSPQRTKILSVQDAFFLSLTSILVSPRIYGTLLVLRWLMLPTAKTGQIQTQKIAKHTHKLLQLQWWFLCGTFLWSQVKWSAVLTKNTLIKQEKLQEDVWPTRGSLWSTRGGLSTSFHCPLLFSSVFCHVTQQYLDFVGTLLDEGT